VLLSCIEEDIKFIKVPQSGKGSQHSGVSSKDTPWADDGNLVLTNEAFEFDA
jgi:hypothetical protein